jgi:hypothetical protein
MSRILRSVGACLAGIVVVFALSMATDFLLAALGLPVEHLQAAAWPFVLAIVVYRNVYNVLGSYLVARLAPDHPMGHALAVGVFGFVLSLVAAIATWNMDLGPHWYSLAIAVLAIPTAWLGARWFVAGREQSAGSGTQGRFPSV